MSLHEHHYVHQHRHHHYYADDQENKISLIPRLLYALMFMASGFAIVVGVAALIYGVYTLFNSFSPAMMISTFLVFPTLMLLLAGTLLPFFTFFGFAGVIREDPKQIKSCYKAMKFYLASSVILGIYISATTYIHIDKRVAVPLTQAIMKYHEDRVSANFINLVQMQFKCCGIENMNDWNLNKEFECDYENLSVQSCNVPYSCCVSGKNNNTRLPTCRINVLRVPLASKKQESVYVEGCKKKIDLYLISTALDMGLLLTCLSITAIFVMRLTGSILLEYNRRRFESLYVRYTRDISEEPPQYEEKATNTYLA